jgi:uncharacterized membrane protein
MSATTMTADFRLSAASRSALKAAGWFWFGVMLIGQMLFAVSVAAFYGHAAWRGQWQSWNHTMTHGYVPGDHLGNVAVGIHLLSAVIVIAGGAVQFVPQLRSRAPRFHRWNGRLYILSAFAVSLAGLYMMWARGTIGTLAQHIGTSLLAVAIIVCAIMALRRAMARDIGAHRRWALRLYVVVSAALFIRAGFTLGGVLAQGVAGIDPSTLSGGFLTFMSFAQYLVPLAVLELYFRAQTGGGAAGRLAMAGGLFALTLLLGAGIAAASVAMWVPAIRAAADSRLSIVDPLAETIAASGPDAAIRQYQDFKTRPAGMYNFDESELNVLGYTLIRSHRFPAAIAMLRLNVAAYPLSANTYDSLGEAYMDAGDRAHAIANYRTSLKLNPANANAAGMLARLGGG